MLFNNKNLKLKSSKIILLLIIVVASFLRLWKLSEVPVSLYIDEVDVGYQAYSILQTGKDYYGNNWPIHFQSIAESRVPFYIYSAVPTVALFGITPLGVRIPSAILGVISVFGIYLLVKELYRFSGNKSKVHADKVALVAALVMAVSPWHIQYSRMAFDGPGLFPFLFFGLYFFFRSIREGKWLWFSFALLSFMPWTYSTAKLFTPILLFLLLLIWKKELLSVSKKYLVIAIFAGLVVGTPIYYDTLYNVEIQRFSHVSIFTDPTVGPAVDYIRGRVATFREGKSLGLAPSFRDRVFYNKVVLWGNKITSNYLKALSFDFLFVNGDPNLRHSIADMGQFYKIESLALIAGLILFFSKFRSKKIKYFVALWILASILPSALTRSGGNHATRLLLMLPPFVFLISYGVVEGFSVFRNNIKRVIYITYFGMWVISVGFYLQNYSAVYPWDSERFWSTGWKEAVDSIREIENKYDRIVFSMTEEPAWILFAGHYEYPPDEWLKEFPIGNDKFVDGFGEISNTGKYYFGSHLRDRELADHIDDKLLYLATRKDVDENLILEPEKIPTGLDLIKIISYPSGEPALYLFSGL